MTGTWYDDESCVQCETELTETGYPQDSKYIGDPGSGAMYEAVSDDVERGYMCLGCSESWESHANTLIAVMPNGDTTDIQYRDGILFDIGRHIPEENIGLDDTGIADAITEIVRGTGWVATDGWRGYESTPTNLTDLVKITDETLLMGRENEVAERASALTDGDVPPEIDSPVIVTINPTSNVCAHGMSVYTLAEQEDTVRKVLME